MEYSSSTKCEVAALKHGNDLRRSHALKYSEALGKVDELVIPVEATYSQHVYHVMRSALGKGRVHAVFGG